jgi:hypothetical protein
MLDTLALPFLALLLPGWTPIGLYLLRLDLNYSEGLHHHPWAKVTFRD